VTTCGRRTIGGTTGGKRIEERDKSYDLFVATKLYGPIFNLILLFNRAKPNLTVAFEPEAEIAQA